MSGFEADAVKVATNRVVAEAKAAAKAVWEKEQRGIQAAGLLRLSADEEQMFVAGFLGGVAWSMEKVQEP